MQDRQRIDEIDKQLVTKKRDADGNLRMTGARAALKSTQAYTPVFGDAIATAWVSKCAPR